MSAERWRRLDESLNVAGFTTRLIEKPYTQESYGRIESGVSRSIMIRDGQRVVMILDSWWRDRWAGYQVWLEGADSLVLRERTRLKSRSSVVEAVTEFLELVEAHPK